MSALFISHFGILVASQDHTGVKVYQTSTLVWTAEENGSRQHVRQMIGSKLSVFSGEFHRSWWGLQVRGSQVHDTHQRWFWPLPMDSIIFSWKVWMEAPSPGRPPSHSHTRQNPSIAGDNAVSTSTAEDISGDAQQYFSLETMKLNLALLTSPHPRGGPLGLSEEEKQYSNSDEASLFANSHRIRSKWRQDVNHCCSLSFYCLLEGKSVCLYFLLFPWSWLFTGDGFWLLSVCYQLLPSLMAESLVLLVPAVTGLTEKDLQSDFWSPLKPYTYNGFFQIHL